MFVWSALTGLTVAVRGAIVTLSRRFVVGKSHLCWLAGMIGDVFDRRNEMEDPPIANIDHTVLVFSLVQPAVSKQALALA
jgi:ribosome biogenesis GTPase